MAVDLDDGVVDIDQRVLLGSLTTAVTVTVVGDCLGAQRLGEPAQREQESGSSELRVGQVRRAGRR
jgi:hypothetical protein